MGVKIMNDPSFYKALGKNVEELYYQMWTGGVVFNLQFYFLTMKKGVHSHTVSLPCTATSIMKSPPGSAELAVVSSKVLTEMKAFCQIVGLLSSQEEAKPAQKKKASPSAAVVDEVDSLDPPEKKAAKTPSSVSGAKVKLKDADHLLQPTYGTDACSTYYTVGIGEVNVSMRVTDGTLSCRAEGNLTPKNRERLAKAGYSEGGKGAYYSCHIKWGVVDLKKVIGSMLLGTGMPFTQVIESTYLLPGVKENAQ